jgi:hypothetical protein
MRRPRCIDSDTLNVTVVQSDLRIAKVEIFEPPGAQDDTLSTDQSFKLRAELVASGDLKNGKVVLRVPPEYKVVPETDTLKAFTGTAITVTWQNLQAPPSAHEIAQDLVVFASGTNGRGESVSHTARLPVVTVDKADLIFNAAINAPPGATDGSMSFNQTFTIRATLLNDGRAGVKDTAKVALDPLPNGFTTTEALEKIIAVGSHVDWQVQAPNRAVNENIAVRFTRPPLDENTDARATVNKTSQILAVRTDSAGTLRIVSWVIEAPRGAA